MVTHKETDNSPYTPAQLFALVADIERYPEFLPWCSAARIIDREEDEIIADLVIRFKAFEEKYTSRVTLFPPDEHDAEGHIVVELIDGPFTHLHNDWLFQPDGNGGTNIIFTLDFKFKSFILEKLIGSVFEKAFSKMTEAFKLRAESLYGK